MAVSLVSSFGVEIMVTLPSASTTSFSSVKATDFRDALLWIVGSFVTGVVSLPVGQGSPVFEWKNSGARGQTIGNGDKESGLLVLVRVVEGGLPAG